MADELNITLALTVKQADELVDILGSYQDEGPFGEGWQSEEMQALCKLVDAAVTKAKAYKDGADVRAIDEVFSNMRIRLPRGTK